MVTTMNRRLRSFVRPHTGCLIGLLVLPALALAATAGPDPAGYTATDAAVYSFIDIATATGAVSVLTGTDDGVVALTPPFPVSFYGHAYPVVCVSTNGALYLVSVSTACQGITDFANTDLETTAPPTDPAAILPFWSDLDFSSAGAGSIFYQTVGAAGSRKLIVQWNDAIPAGGAAPVTFQVVLAEGSSRILFQYRSVDLGPTDPSSKGGQATIGIRNALALVNHEQLPWSFSAPVVGDRSAIVFDLNVRTAPVITWPAPAAIVYGTPLGGSQLNASTNVSGSFAYTPPASTVLNAGAAQPLSTTFTPSDTTRYTTGTAGVTIDVNRAPLVVTPANATKVIGDTFTSFTGTLATVVNSDPITARYSSAGAAAGAAVGSYPIAAQLNDPNSRLSNYIVTLNTGTLKVIYNPTVGHQFLPPIGILTFKAASVIAVKFQLFMANGTTPVSTAVATLQVVQVVACSGPPGGVVASGTFRYDPRMQQYVDNLMTGRTWCGTYRLTAGLDDGSNIVGTVEIR
jgi:MBG domain-containing protein